MAKRKTKSELIEKTLEQEMVSPEVIEVVAQKEEAIKTETSETVTPLQAQKSSQEDMVVEADSTQKVAFFGREYVESRFPQTIDLADRFVHEWKTEGDFEFLPIQHPVAKEFVQNGIKKIKLAEKQIEAKYLKDLAPHTQKAFKQIEKVIQRFR